jgi:hypothetical protein
VGGLVSGRGHLPSASSGRPVARFDDVIDQSGHVVLAARCRVAEYPAAVTSASETFRPLATYVPFPPRPATRQEQSGDTPASATGLP